MWRRSPYFREYWPLHRRQVLALEAVSRLMSRDEVGVVARRREIEARILGMTRERLQITRRVSGVGRGVSGGRQTMSGVGPWV
jgi:hypothetical protein